MPTWPELLTCTWAFPRLRQLSLRNWRQARTAKSFFPCVREHVHANLFAGTHCTLASPRHGEVEQQRRRRHHLRNSDRFVELVRLLAGCPRARLKTPRCILAWTSLCTGTFGRAGSKAPRQFSAPSGPAAAQLGSASTLAPFARANPGALHAHGRSACRKRECSLCRSLSRRAQSGLVVQDRAHGAGRFSVGQQGATYLYC